MAPLNFVTCCTCGEKANCVSEEIFTKRYNSICYNCLKIICEKKFYQSKKLSSRISTRNNFLLELKNSLVPTKYLKCTVDNFIDRSNVKKNIAYAWRNNQFIFITSPGVGNGKTHLGVAILKKYLWHGTKVKFVDSNDLMITLRNSFSGTFDLTEEKILQEFKTKKCVLFDDFGISKNTEYTVQAWNTIINTRYSFNLPTIITSNLSLDMIKNKIDQRISSRIGSGIILNIQGPDLRTQKGK